ncbi:phage tail tape measure protein [Paraburkholderia sp. NMBU_R16]|uniref:phage tail tape measure protein n=1 Tax=Paraburkholderia sp. NMBU_R16 TaxID=2698676 RepID=UPI0015647DE4|nr:phage tail tape measure protein [Paraburkholderia sp. NMBU_R16]NRO98132.1 phage tail tape measure protein [Paraburkholderia sp. NMBU_R16]
MDNALKLRVMFDMVDNMTKPLKNVLAGSKGLAHSLKQPRRELAEMSKKQKDIAEFRELRQGLASTTSQLRAAQARVTDLAGAMRAVGPPARSMVKQFESSKRVAAGLTAEHERQSARVQRLREQLSAAGISTRNLAEHQRNLSAQARTATRTLREQEDVLTRVSRQQQKLHAARAQLNSAKQTAGSVAAASAAGGAIGGGILFGAKRLLSSGYEFDAAMSRVQALARIEKESAELSALRLQARKLGATTSFTAGEAASGQGFLAMAGFTPDQILQAMPGVLSMAKAGDTDLARTADISSNILTGFGLKADEMNRIADVLTMTFTTSNTTLEMLGGTMKYVGPVARAAGMSLEQAAATAGLLGNAGIQATQAGTTLRSMLLRLSAPTSGASAALKELGVRALDARGNVRDIPSILRDVAKATEKLGSGTRLDYLKQIFGEEPAAGMSELIAQQGAQGIEKYVSILRNASGTAQGVASVMADNLKGDLLTTQSAFADLGVSISDAVNPALRAFMQSVTGYLGRASRWVQENPRLARTLGTITLALGGILAALSALALMLATMIGPLALLRFGLTTLGIQGGILTRALTFGTAAWRMFSAAALVAGRALLANPIGIAVAALAAAAFLIYRHWAPIKAFFSDLWQAVQAAFNGGIANIASLLTKWSPLTALWQALVTAVASLGAQLPAKFVTLGENLVAGLVKGLTAGLGAVKTAITNLATSSISWFKAKLGIHSPSRVFGELGGFISRGAANGIEDQQTRVARASLGLATAAAAAFGLPAIATGAQLTKTAAVPLVRPSVPIGTRQPLASAPAAAKAAAAPSSVTVNVYPPPGVDAAEIARMVRAELERAERAKQSRIASRLTD